MKGTVKLIDPEERFEIEIDAWSRLMFERNSVKHGIPRMPASEAVKQYPETFMCICAYYAIQKHKLLNGISYEDFEMRWDGIEIQGVEKEEITNPTNPAV